MDPKYIDNVWKRARFESHQLGLGDVVTRFALNIREDVLESAAKLCEDGNLSTNYACAEAIREMKATP